MLPTFFLVSIIIIGCQPKETKKTVELQNVELQNVESQNPIGFIPLEKEYRVGDFREGLAPVSIERKYGFIDTLGKEVIPCIYDDAYGFSEGLAAVRIERKYGFIDKTGKEIIPCIYDNVKPCTYDNVNEIEEGLVMVNIGGEWTERIVGQSIGKNFRGGKWGIIDKTGKEITPCIYFHIKYFSDGLAVVNIDKYGVIDKTGKEVIPCIYDKINCFSEGYAFAIYKGKHGLLKYPN